MRFKIMFKKREERKMEMERERGREGRANECLWLDGEADRQIMMLIWGAGTCCLWIET